MVRLDLESIWKEFLKESVSTNNIVDAIDKKYQVEISYDSEDNGEHLGTRIIEPVAYGLTKAGNPVIRAFQPYGDTTTTVPNWKFFRVDRIKRWKTTENYFVEEPSYYYNNIGDFNPNGDKTMSVVYKIADFSKPVNPDKSPAGPRKKTSPTVKLTPNQRSQATFKTDTERGLAKLRKQLDNPVYAPGYGPVRKEQPPVTQEPVQQQTTTSQPKQDDVFKTDTERGMERLRQQLNNPRYAPGYGPNKQQQTPTNTNVTGYGPKRKDDNSQQTQPEAPKPDATRNTPGVVPDKEIPNSQAQKLDSLNKQLQNPRYVSPDILDRWKREQERRNRR